MAFTKHEQLYQHICDNILSGRLRPGQSLPKQTELMQEHGVALSTVRQALERLKQEHWTRATRGKGTFICHPTERAGAEIRSATVALVEIHDGSNSLGPNIDPEMGDQVMRLQRAVEKRGHELVVRRIEPSQLDALGAWSERFAGLVMYRGVTEAVLRSVMEYGTPVCVIGEVDEGVCPPGVSQVLTDLSAGAEMALQYLVGQGHTRVLFLNRGATNANRILSEGFTRAIQDGRLDRGSREFLVVSAEHEERLIAQMPSLDPQPTALLAFGGMLACRVIHKLERAGRPVPRHIGVMALNTIAPGRLSEPDLSRVQIDMGQAVQYAADILQEQIETGKSVRQVVTPRLYWGTTCGANRIESAAAVSVNHRPQTGSEEKS